MLNTFPWTHPAEMINPSLRSPRQHPRCSFTIAKSREHALAEATTCQMDSLCIFTDGSGYQDMVGAAATTLPQGGDLASEHRHHCLGPLHTHTVFEGEILGAILALDIIRGSQRTTNVTVLLDNQAAIRSLQQRQPRPGQYLVEEFHARLDTLLKRNPHLNIRICWVPGHEGNKGNEFS